MSHRFAALAACAAVCLGVAQADPGVVPAEVLQIAKDVRTAPGELPRLEVTVNGKQAPLPLRETQVFAELSTHVAQVSVTQVYQNDFDRPIEAQYVFPLPENSAVDDMKIEIGGRVIVAEIQERKQAQATFNAARRAGHTAALLEQERPNIFTQTVTNIPPGEAIRVTVRFVQQLSYDKGEYEWVFPMVVGPRFIPGNAVGKQGRGWAPDTDQVPDASRITPPIIGAGTRTGHDIDIEVVVDSALPIVDLQTPTHAVEAHTHDDGVLNVRLADGDTLPNRDFVLRYTVDGDAPQVAVQAHRTEKQGHFALTIQPPRMDVDGLVGQRELIFVIDVSGSMYGKPLAQAKATARAAIDQLRPVDTFNVYTFAGRTAKAFKGPRPANETSVRDALAFIDGARAGGGTMLGRAVEDALSPPVEDGRHRYVVFLTDGYIGNESQIFDSARSLVKDLARKGQRARVFGLGIGNSVNRHLITGLGEAGKGLGLVLTLNEREETAVRRIYRLIDQPVLQDVVIDWGDLDVEQVYPTVLPDVLASRPVVVHGAYHKAGAGVVTVRGKDMSGKPVRFKAKVTLPEESTHGGAIASLWARARIHELSRSLWGGHDQTVVDAITTTGINHRIVTQYTSFVAVDRSRVVEGEAVKIDQPVERADGVDIEKATGLKARSGKFVSSIKDTSKLTQAGPVRQNVMGTPQPLARQLNHAMSGVGDNLVIGHGAGGMGFGGLGTGAGGGGSGYGRIHGMGRIDTGGGYGRGASRLSERKGRAPKVIPGKPTIMGSLDKETIRRVIRRHRNEVRYCYEKQLNRDPKLQGKVRITAEIGPNGKVKTSAIADSTLKNEQVEKCLTTKVKRWVFPAPKGGGVVKFTYPFMFLPAKTKAKARARLGTLAVTGGLPLKDVARVVKARARGVQYCYEKALNRRPDLSGKLKVRVEIAADGRVTAATVTSDTVADTKVTGCVARQMRRWRFPKADDGKPTVAEVPLTFSIQ